MSWYYFPRSFVLMITEVLFLLGLLHPELNDCFVSLLGDRARLPLIGLASSLCTHGYGLKVALVELPMMSLLGSSVSLGEELKLIVSP